MSQQPDGSFRMLWNDDDILSRNHLFSFAVPNLSRGTTKEEWRQVSRYLRTLRKEVELELLKTITDGKEVTHEFDEK